MITPTQWIGLIIIVQHAVFLLPGRLATDGHWVHAGVTIGLAGQVVGCANCAAGAAVTIRPQTSATRASMGRMRSAKDRSTSCSQRSRASACRGSRGRRRSTPLRISPLTTTLMKMSDSGMPAYQAATRASQSPLVSLAHQPVETFEATGFTGGLSYCRASMGGGAAAPASRPTCRRAPPEPRRFRRLRVLPARRNRRSTGNGRHPRWRPSRRP